MAKTRLRSASINFQPSAFERRRIMVEEQTFMMRRDQLSAVGEIMPASVRDHLVAASNWCWRRRLGKIDEPDLVGTMDKAQTGHAAS